MIVLGIDPGTAQTGYGVIKISKNKEPICLDYGVIKTTKGLKPWERLKKIEKEFQKLIRKYKPQILAIESLYFFKNAKTIITVSQAKGVILLTAEKKGLKIKEFTPLEVKMNICGYGRATKFQIQKMVKNILKLTKAPYPDDAADALAIALSASYLDKIK
jgi:crossover junction endodeoxyribonuclease RuvC